MSPPQPSPRWRGAQSERKRWAAALLLAVALEGGLIASALWFWMAPDKPQAVVKAVTKRAPLAVMFQGVKGRSVEMTAPVAAAELAPKKRLPKKQAVSVVAVESPTPELAVAPPDAVADPPPVLSEATGSKVEQLGAASGGGDGAVSRLGSALGGGAVDAPGELEGRDLSRYAVLILSELTANRRVPAQAARMRLQGSALLELHIGGQGQLAGVRVVQSSGHGVLDEAALQTVRDSAPFPAPPGNLLAKFTVPIRYTQ